MAGILSRKVMQGPPESLFQQLFGLRSHIEVNLSRAFAMCFRESPAFANAVLTLLYKTCRVAGSPLDRTWECLTEVTFSKGRPDIEIRASGVLFRLESKVGAPLTRQQLLRYRFQGKGQYLLAITQRPPDVGRVWMAKKGVFSLRWQEIHRAVATAKAKRHESYLRDSFCLYLQELGMAHREAVRPEDLMRLYDLLETIASSQRWRSVKPRNTFDVAESCLHLLREVARDARDEVPKLQTWRRAGPFYSKNREDDGHFWHHLGFYFQRNRETLGAGFSFEQGGDYARWQTWRVHKPSAFDDSRALPFKSLCGEGDALDRGKMLRAFLRSARMLGFKG